MATSKGIITEPIKGYFSASFFCDACSSIRYLSYHHIDDLHLAWTEYQRSHVLCSGHEVDIVTGLVL